ncbi:signal transduction histidine kinase [Natronospira proteinivora]|uniref:histidine kinase n=1 Tax=Natronospira proteinivora TaxID=1807133 RepID=A0ABT1G7C9_9GAMM|nr:ATP-binding protein [Natronospira proteinivora]MCP1727206.1 signal transduction histidine kinase [Natronospira proteinivora]
MKMTEASQSKPTIRVPLSRYPWPSALGALLLATYLLLLGDPILSVFYSFPEQAFQAHTLYVVVGGFMALMLLDLRRFQRVRRRQQQKVKQLQEQLDELWSRNRQLQLKAHTYAGHADKLKLFISDKLLEYIEYDEKFLHFKGIAAEVRHNGVISFDKVQTALRQAQESTEAEPARQTLGEAQDAMRYLWDLLDLSTADNLSLHIGNHLCECEEQYCQRLLNADQQGPPPFEPLCDPRKAAWQALGLLQPERPALPESSENYQVEDGEYHIQLSPVSALLGKENHLVLMLDNLIKNAQFFSRKVTPRVGIPPLSMTLGERAGHVIFRLYNRGPHIPVTDQEQLFQLGFSTRRSRDHHGRGLGLYFVNEIVKGYEGQIHLDNVAVPEGKYLIELELADGQREAISAEVRLSEGRIHCRPSKHEDSAPEDSHGPVQEEEHPTAARCRWALSAPLQRAWVRHEDEVRPIELAEFAPKGKQSRMDPEYRDRPRWQLSYHPGKRQPSLSFEALDIRGVQFEIRLPTPQTRLEASEPPLDDAVDAEVEALDQQFRPPE